MRDDLDEPAGGAWNMAVDHALADAARGGAGVLRFYRWRVPTVSLGRNEPARDVYDGEAAAREGVAFVRRPTGGRAVLHDREVTYAVAVPLRALGGVRQTYRRIHEGLREGLARLGVAARVAEGGVVERPDAGPCFRAPAPGEVTVGGRKLVGSAQVRLGRALLQHGSLLLADDQPRLRPLRRAGRAEAGGEPPPPATLAELLGRAPALDVLADALAGGMEDALGGRWERASLRAEEREGARGLLERYASPEWTWRR